MTAKAQYIPNGYVCNKCGSRMDAIITPPLSTLGKIKLVCNNCNKYMNKNWQERFEEEFWGKFGSIKTINEIKQFISQAIDQTREETIKEILKLMPTIYEETTITRYDFLITLEDKLKSLINK